MRFRSLGSGSTGNATLIETRDGTRHTRVLVDAGFSLRELTLRLAQAGLAAADIDAIFITHEHGDHIGCAMAFRRRHGTPVWMSRGTWAAVSGARSEDMPVDDVAPACARDGDTVTIGALQLTPFTVPHDAREPLQLRCSDGHSTLGLLTDAGCATPHLLDGLRAVDALLLETNHDRAMLAASAYPPALKARIGGRLGHLANDTAAQILGAVHHGGLRHVVAAHLSERNNTPTLAARALAGVLGCADGEVVVARPDTGTPWLSLR